MQIFRKFKEIVSILGEYKRSIRYVRQKRGLKGVYNFLFAKFAVADEGGEMCLFTPLFRLFPWILRFPYKVEMEHTTICDKKCILCEHTYWDEKSERLDFEQFKARADQFPGLKWTNITGEGSGFLNPDFLKMIKYLRDKDVSVNFVDEFDFLDEGKARKLIEYGVNCIWLSMDGASKETYERIKVGCNFDNAVKNIKMLLDLKKEYHSPLPTLCFRFVVNSLNYKEMPRMVELVSSFKKYGDLGDGTKLEFAGLLTFKEIEKYYLPEVPEEILEETKKAGERLGVRVQFAHIGKSKLPPIKQCAAWAEPYILISGHVMPCCAVLMSNKRAFLRKYSFGNVNEKSFKEIWNSKRYQRFRALVAKDKGPVPILCANCRAYDTKEREKRDGISKEI